MRTASSDRCDRLRAATGGALRLLACGLTACGNGLAQTDKPAAPAGPPTIDVVRVVEQPLNVTLSLPGELDPYETVAIYPRVTGFVKTIRVDRGSRVRAGELMAVLEAPEAAGAAGGGAVEAAERRGAARPPSARRPTRTRARTTSSKAASATPGVVAGNDLILAQKAVEADQSQIAAAQQNVEAARQALHSVTDMEGYLRVTAPFDGVVTERNVHPGALVGPSQRARPRPCRWCASSRTIDCASSFRCPRRTPRASRRHHDDVHGCRLSRSDVFRHGRANCTGGRRQDAHDGRRARRDEQGRPARARHVLPGSMARASAGAVAVRAERQRREHDRIARSSSGSATDKPSGST